MSKIDWNKLKAEYISGGTSYRKLTEKYEVSLSTLKRVAKNEGWVELRTQAQNKSNTEIIKKVSKENSKNAKKILQATTKLLDKIISSIEERKNLTGQEIKQYTSALKDLRDIIGMKSEADMAEQEARIANLNKQLNSDKCDNITIKIEGGAEQWQV